MFVRFSIASLFVPTVINTDNGVSLLDAMDQGLCGASIMGMYTFRSLQSQGHCDKVLLDQTVLSFGLAWPVQSAWQVLFSAATVTAVMDGDYSRLQASAEQAWSPASICNLEESANAASESLRIGDLAGIVFIYVLSLIAALLVNALAKAANEKHVKKQLSRLTLSGSQLSHFRTGSEAHVVTMSPVTPASASAKKRVSMDETSPSTTTTPDNRL